MYRGFVKGLSLVLWVVSDLNPQSVAGLSNLLGLVDLMWQVLPAPLRQSVDQVQCR
jgi:hypothetical protein